MASHRRPKQPSRARVTIFGATAAATVALTSQSASADPNPTKNEVKERVDELYEQVTEITEEYNGAKEREGEIKERAEELQEAVARGQEELNELRNSLGSVASAQYRNGGLAPSMQLFLSADPDGYLEQASTLGQVTAKQAEALRTIETKQRTLAQQRAEAGEQLEELESTREEIKGKKDKIQGKLTEAQTLLNRLTEEERRQLAEAEAAEQARAAEAAARATRTEDRTDLGGSGSGSGTATATTQTAPPTTAGGSGRAQTALSMAQSKIGSPYVYGSAGPSTFDCSGLTSWAYAQAGISLPRTSQAQANAGTRVSQSELQPGDLVFYYSGISHVGMYVGNGQIVHAPRPGSSVHYAGVNSMPFMFGVRVA
ncbi:NlpC/P60 family protein [Streptomyces sp. ST2-7A]|uniref:C40 family peptidase n=1 Tax=Streptomyces sp. ST2-7A TaxID=2907214 RepID=UPI001F186CDA|nr:C40 family peptidase [Streptomyces sp. ST2-7A]MCE7083308.1 NlpC/P60 family protein [Streptomyces sp. ST2-7A]